MMLRPFHRPWRAAFQPITTTTRCFTAPTFPLHKKALPPRPKPPPDSEIEEFYLKGSGPGGQKINKTNSAVQLRHTPTGIVVKSQATRSRDQNRKYAREILAQRVDEHFNGDQSRSAIVGKIKQKKAASADKKKRRKYKKLEEEGQIIEKEDKDDVEDVGEQELKEHAPAPGAEEQTKIDTPTPKP